MFFVFLAGLIVPQSMVAQTESVLYNFCSLTNCADGHGPAGTLVRDANGNFYGATEGGGAAEGTVFKVSPDGGETVIYNFEFANNDGSFPEDGVIIDAQRNLYGTTLYGGSANLGTVYKISPAGSETILHSFTGGTSDGIGPYGPLLRDKNGNFYGTTAQGGAYFYGIIYRLTPDGAETILHYFNPDEHDGAGPITGLTMDKLGNVYGVAIAGGRYKQGVVFEINSKGRYSILHNFGVTATDGNAPATLTLGASGDLYGTTAFGGTYGAGTVFKLVRGANWNETVLYSFGSSTTDGQDPLGVPLLDAQGNLYGTTFIGGNAACGTIYKLTPSGEETILHDFGGTGDGCNPDGGLLKDSKGAFYGVTFAGGTGSYTPGGVVYKLVP
jgi:uncharacterized repeat protein (TIGR03803 family)